MCVGHCLWLLLGYVGYCAEMVMLCCWFNTSCISWIVRSQWVKSKSHRYRFYRYNFETWSSKLAGLLFLLIYVEGLLAILIDCLNFLSPFLDVLSMSMLTFFIVVKLDSEILCIDNIFLFYVNYYKSRVSIYLSSLGSYSVFRYVFLLCLFLLTRHLVVATYPCQNALHKKWSFPLRISLVNVTKTAVSWILVSFTDEIRNGGLHFLCSN